MKEDWMKDALDDVVISINFFKYNNKIVNFNLKKHYQVYDKTVCFKGKYVHPIRKSVEPILKINREVDESECIKMRETTYLQMHPSELYKTVRR